MTTEAAVAAFTSRFKYRKGRPDLFGRDIRDTAEGDCHDFVAAVLRIIEPEPFKAQLARRAVVWRVWSPQSRFWPTHIALQHKTFRWTDSRGEEHVGGWINSTPQVYDMRAGGGEKIGELREIVWMDGPVPHVPCWPAWIEQAVAAAGLAGAAWSAWLLGVF
jgi:hypothetical protein